MLNDVQLAKLPKYAQEEIVALRRTIEDLRRALLEQQQDVPTRVRWGREWKGDDSGGYLPDLESVSFRILDRPNRYVRVRLTDDGLSINADGSVQILCESSNCFTVQERPR